MLSAIGIALAAHFSLYPVMLLCPLALMVNKVRTNSYYTHTTYKIESAIMIVFVLPGLLLLQHNIFPRHLILHVHPG